MPVMVRALGLGWAGALRCAPAVAPAAAAAATSLPPPPGAPAPACRLPPVPPAASRLPSPHTASYLQDVAVNVVGKYRYRMTSPADSTWVPLIIDIILVGAGGLGGGAGAGGPQAGDPGLPCAAWPSRGAALQEQPPLSPPQPPGLMAHARHARPRPAGGPHQDHHAAQRHLAGERDRQVGGRVAGPRCDEGGRLAPKHAVASSCGGGAQLAKCLASGGGAAAASSRPLGPLPRSCPWTHPPQRHQPAPARAHHLAGASHRGQRGARHRRRAERGRHLHRAAPAAVGCARCWQRVGGRECGRVPLLHAGQPGLPPEPAVCSPTRCTPTSAPCALRPGCYLPITAVLGGRLFLRPDGFQEASRDVVRLSPDIAYVLSQQAGDRGGVRWREACCSGGCWAGRAWAAGPRKAEAGKGL